MAAILECSSMCRHTISIKKARYHRYRSRFWILLKRSKRCLSSFSTELCSFCSATALSQKAMGSHSQTYSPLIFVYIFSQIVKGVYFTEHFAKAREQIRWVSPFLKILASIPNPFNTRSSENDPQEILQFLNKFYHRCLGWKKHPSRGTKSEMLAAKGSKIGLSSAYLDKFANKLGIRETMKIDRNKCFFLKLWLHAMGSIFTREKGLISIVPPIPYAPWDWNIYLHLA